MKTILKLAIILLITTGIVQSSFATTDSTYKLVSSYNVCSNKYVVMPVQILTTVSEVIGYDIVLQFDSTKLIFDSVHVYGKVIDSSYVSAFSYNPPGSGTVNLTLALNGNAPAGTTFNGIGDLFSVVFSKTSNFGPKDIVSFTITSLRESYYTGTAYKYSKDGVYKSFSDSVYTGSLKYYTSQIPIKGLQSGPSTNIYGNNSFTTACGTKTSTPITADSLGNFHYTIDNGYAMVIERPIPLFTSLFGVLTGNDAYLLRMALQGSSNPSALQLLAMDVNLDGKLSAGDLSQLNQRIVNQIGEFAQAGFYNNQGQSLGNGPSKSWLFVDSVTLNSPAFTSGYSPNNIPSVPGCIPVNGHLTGCTSFVPETVTGLLVGDIDGSWASYAANNNSPVAKLTSNGEMNTNDLNEPMILLDLANKKTNADSSVEIPVSIIANQKVNSIDFSFTENNSEQVFSGFSNFYEPSLEWLANKDLDNTIMFTSSSLSTLPSNTNLFTLNFKPSKSQITANDIQIGIGLINGKSAKVKITQPLENQADYRITICPNPSKGIFKINTPETVTLNITDIAGGCILSNKIINSGENSIIDLTAQAKGVYFVRLSNSNYITTKKIVVE